MAKQNLITKSDMKTFVFSFLAVAAAGLTMYFGRSWPVVGDLLTNARKGFDA